MFPVTRLKQYLEQEKVPCRHTFHRTTFTSQEVASEEHVSGKMVAKAVVIKVNGSFALAVLPASEQVDVPALQAALEAKELRLATGFEFRGLITECKPAPRETSRSPLPVNSSAPADRGPLLPRGERLAL